MVCGSFKFEQVLFADHSDFEAIAECRKAVMDPQIKCFHISFFASVSHGNLLHEVWRIVTRVE